MTRWLYTGLLGLLLAAGSFSVEMATAADEPTPAPKLHSTNRLQFQYAPSMRMKEFDDDEYKTHIVTFIEEGHEDGGLDIFEFGQIPSEGFEKHYQVYVDRFATLAKETPSTQNLMVGKPVQVQFANAKGKSTTISYTDVARKSQHTTIVYMLTSQRQTFFVSQHFSSNGTGRSRSLAAVTLDSIKSH